MSLNLSKGKMLPIGVDLGSSTLKVAQLRYLDDLTELVAATAAELPLAARKDSRARLDFLTDRLREVVRNKTYGFKGPQCILSLPAAETFVQHVRVPRMSPEDTAKAVRLELQGKMPWAVHEAVIRHIPAGELPGDGEVKQEVIAVAAPRATILSYINIARKAGLDPIGVNVESCAIVECFSRLFRRNADAARTILYLDIGATTTQVVLAHGVNMVFARNLRLGGEQLDQAVADGLKISPEQGHAMRADLLDAQRNAQAGEELYRLLSKPLNIFADELMQCLRYYESVFRNQSVERAIFLGGQAYDKRLCQLIAQRLNLPAQIGDPLVRLGRVQGAGLGIGLDRREPQPNWAVAVGLSLGGQAA